MPAPQQGVPAGRVHIRPVLLLQPAQESVAAMLARDPMWAICTPEPEPEPEPKPEPESEPEPAKTRKGKASKEE